MSSNRLILKTCGTTPLLRATIYLMKVVEEECGMTEVKVECKNLKTNHVAFTINPLSGSTLPLRVENAE